MPVQKTIYDRETGEALVRAAIDAEEAVQNDPSRYSYRPWKNDGKVSKKDAAKAAAAAKRGKPVAAATEPEPVPDDQGPGEDA